MSNSSPVIVDKPHLSDELACYLQSDALDIVLPNVQVFEINYHAKCHARKFIYQLPLGELQLLKLLVYLPDDIPSINIESMRKTLIKSALAWHKNELSKQTANLAPTIEALVFDIQFKNAISASNNSANKDSQGGKYKRLKHSFPASYFMEDLIIDMSDSEQPLQIFGWHDWQLILSALHTPCELWRFLNYRLGQLKQGVSSRVPSIESEGMMIDSFLNNPALFTQAIAIDNVLIKYGMQDEPNSALITMALAQKNQSATNQMYRQHMEQAAILWSELSSQMLEVVSKSLSAKKSREQQADFSHWQQQILDESLFSRHELIRTLYRHPKQDQQLHQQGYVVHQHSYESLGRHYVLIFYGQDAEGQHSKKAIQPNLSKIALDVATRLPIAELHHVIVLGIDFINETNDTFIDIDLWIQPVAAMSQRERHLTKQIQQLQQQNLKP